MGALLSNARKTRRDPEPPHAVFKAAGWTWRVLKANTKHHTRNAASWFCEVSSPHTMGSSDLGDVYVYDIARFGAELVLVDGRPPTADEYAEWVAIARDVPNPREGWS